ncbi:metalloregulator ArsR/SmtB family transcription factor [Fructilactobacillus myrtifloralis]|uniref:Metalloregulator ArsR/SmtB family transcription factor n=1 Tax=Fructilactobacillus myrtifloralis TaxID=2940301 RepID=A0ABY5BNL5_9LACO|nr:metalloregulator ArsR/SmtB family transcription factor [Fructilactobacillus myrtifloralis]USS84561.1 metalloregulator ArsR/SmtB family transcription factor [Fructilactobacillus myrtifloralis]
MVKQSDLTETSQIFKLLVNPERLRILLLLENNPVDVSTIVTKLQLSQSNVSHQLALLKKHQLVSAQRTGKRMLYSLNDPHILTIVEMAYQHSEHVVKHEQHHYLRD